MKKEKTLEEKLREISNEELSYWTIQRIVNNEIWTDERRAQASKARKGRKITEEQKQKLSEALKGRVFSDEHKERLSKGRKGIVTRNNAKLTEQQVLEIRSKYVPRKYSTLKLAKEYGLSVASVYEIVTRKTWTHI